MKTRVEAPPDDYVVAAGGECWIPETDSDKAAVQEQLDRLLASPSFTNSSRYPALLRFVVERCLEGHTDSLKERSLGIEVFHRDLDYDNNQDPVVRNSAVEVRKRLAQYYRQAGHECEIRISLPAGSYKPEFRLPGPAVPIPAVRRPPKRQTFFRAWIYTVGGAVALTLALFWWSPWTASTALDRFWRPIWRSSGDVLICVGWMGDTSASGTGKGVPLAEVRAVTEILGTRKAAQTGYRIRPFFSTDFQDLMKGAVILVGGFDNEWTTRLLDEMNLRFHLERDGSAAWIADRQHPEQRNWLVDTRSAITRDYAVISRVRYPGTGKEMVSIAVLSRFGTVAAGEFLSAPPYLGAAVAAAGKAWDSKNMQIVIGTELTDGNAGPPQVLALDSWK